jgi:hypothetical protein
MKKIQKTKRKRGFYLNFSYEKKKITKPKTKAHNE